MPKYRKFTIWFLILLLMLPVPGAVNVRANGLKEQVDIMFVHDTHSHLNSFSTIRNDKDVVAGGFSRIKTLIDMQKEEKPDTFVFDAGDFSMGTLVQTIYESQAAELRMLGEIGCDVTTLGNHEFDYRSSGLSNMLKTAALGADPVPSIVLCNVDWESMEKKGLTEEQKMIKDAFDAYGVKDYTVIEKGDIQIAVIGVFGKDSLACAPTCALEFKDAPSAVKRTVEEIKEKENADMIVCVSHSGTFENAKDSEDEILAKEVPEIDLIVSGHTHTELQSPIRHGSTYIVSCGEYGKNLGSLSMSRGENGRWQMDDYELLPIDDRIEADADTDRKIEGFMRNVDQLYLSQFGYTRNQVIAENDIKFTSLEDMSESHEEQNLGSIMADAYKYAVESSEGPEADEVDVTVVPSGTVRDTYTKGPIRIEDVFNSFSLGIGKDGIPGYPLISVYLTGKELKVAAEIDASVSDYMTTARLYMNGLYFTYNPNRMILNKVTDCYLVNGQGERVEIEDKKLYRVVSDLYSGQMLGAVTEKSFGILSVVPKTADGTPVENYEDAIIMEDGKELKAWDAIARYMISFADTDGNGIANIPEQYAAEDGRKVVDNSRNVFDLVKSPNRFAVLIVCIVIAAIAIVVVIIMILRKNWKNYKKKQKRLKMRRI